MQTQEPRPCSPNPQLDIMYLGDTTIYSPTSESTHLSVKGGKVVELADGTLVMPEFALSFSGHSQGPRFGAPMHSYDLASALAWAQGGLEIAEAVPHPFVSTPAGLANAGISMVRGHYGDAGWSALTAVPILGTIGKVGKLAFGQAAKLERHHLLPIQFKKAFERVGLDIEQFTVDLSKAKHRLKPDGLHTGANNWNQQWKDFFKDRPDRTQAKILGQLERMKSHYGLK